MKRSIILLCLLSSLLTAAFAQTQQNIDTMPTGERLLKDVHGAFFALSVSNLDKSIAWYSNKLGYRIVNRGNVPNRDIRFALMSAEGSVLELIERGEARSLKSVMPDANANDNWRVYGIFKAGFVVDDLDAVYRRITGSGVVPAYDIMPARDIPLRSFSVKDPDGNLIQFFGK